MIINGQEAETVIFIIKCVVGVEHGTSDSKRGVSRTCTLNAKAYCIGHLLIICILDI
jgi:hypothetical protein